MKISGKQLEMALSKMKYSLIGYKDDVDMEVEISFTSENPGAGAMIECLTLKAVKPSSTEEDRVEAMTVEIYPVHEKQEPRASKTESFTIKSRY